MITRHAILLELLKVALGKSDTPTDSQFPTLANCENLPWTRIWDEAIAQGVDGLVYRALPLIGTHRRPPYELLMQMSAQMATREREHTLYCNSLWPVLDQLQATRTYSGVPVVMLKGLTLGALWPEPAHRPIGDVDLYAPIDNHSSLLQRLAEMQAVIDRQFDCKHVAFQLGGLNWELHYRTAHFFWSSTERQYHQLEMRYCQRNDLCHLSLDEHSIAVFHPLFNTLYLTAHLQHHLLLEEVTLRQLVDWMLAIQSERASLAVAENMLIDQLKRLNLWRLYRALGYICQTYLGMGVNQYAGLSNLTAAERHRGEFLRHILLHRRVPGCRRYEPRMPDESWIKKARLFGELIKRCFLLFRLAPKEAFATPFGIIRNAIRRRLGKS